MNYTGLFVGIQYWMKNQYWYLARNLMNIVFSPVQIVTGKWPAISLILYLIFLQTSAAQAQNNVHQTAKAKLHPSVAQPANVRSKIKTLFHTILIPTAKPPAKPPRPVSKTAKKALMPLLNYQISELDKSTVKAIVEAISRKDYDKAISLRNILSDKSALSLINWFYFRKANHHYSIAEAQHFIKTHKNWPNIWTIKKNTERAALSALEDQPSKVAIINLFQKRKPVSKQGKIKLALALLENGQAKRALTIIRPLWHASSLSKKQEATLLSRFSTHLSISDHEKRINYLLYKHQRKFTNAAKRLFKYIPSASKTVHALRIRYITSRRVKEKLFTSLSPTQRTHSGLLFNRAKWLRRRKRQTEAWDLLAQPNDLKKQPSILSALDWRERNMQIRTALNKGHAPVAYAIALQHGKLSGTKKAESSFLAGWLALRFMNNPQQALKHFSTIKNAVLEKHLKAKLYYWLGRTYSTLSLPTKAQHYWSKAAAISHDYYGQLAFILLEPGKTRIGLRPLPQITAKDTKSFTQNNIVRAIMVAHNTGMHSMKGRLIRHLSWTLRNPVHMALLAELTHHTSKKRDIIKLAKVGIYRNVPLDIYAYPANALPKDYQRLNNPVEKNLISALVRQESEFNRNARSPVGARGLMQLMPGTAKQIARKYKISYSKAMLTVSPSYNVMLGSALLRDLLDKYNGSYILTLIAYNAGPGRANRWSLAFGNPGDDHIDPIDWVERIPFKETRRYVQKILSSLQFFRERSGIPRPMRLMTDLERGGTVIKTALTPVQ